MTDLRHERYYRWLIGVLRRDGNAEEPASVAIARGGGERSAGEDAAEGEDVGGGGDEG
jgi:hypothetical protein